MDITPKQEQLARLRLDDLRRLNSVQHWPSVGPTLWAYLELLLDRRLSEAERQRILHDYYGHK